MFGRAHAHQGSPDASSRSVRASLQVPRVFEAVCKCTLDMITKNFEDFPEHRSLLFNLLRAMNQHCFGALLQQQANFTLIIESIKVRSPAKLRLLVL